MCGIVGILGRGPVADQIVDSLKRLEYRGYDSAGVATLEGDHLERRRAEGKLKNLETRLKAEPLAGHTGIGHTRWATHGKPTENNAHPHATERVAVVHNGIIENFRELREALQKKGAVFKTETDTEIVVHLVDSYLAKGINPVEAVKASLSQLRGAFALGFIFAGDDDLMIGARNGPPLAIGYGEGEMYLGSDAIALGPFTDTISYLEDGDWVVLTRNSAVIYDKNDAIVHREAIKHSAATSLVDKANYRHFMAKEIHEQPEVVGHTLARYVDMATERVALPTKLPFDFKDIQRISIIACGTASYAGYVAKYWFERLGRVPVELDVASEFRYREAPLRKGDLAIFISQSGETADTLAALRYAKAQGVHTLSVVNVPTSTIARESETVLPTLAGPEIGVASTKAFTCQLMVLAAIAIAAGKARGELSDADEAKLVHGLVEIPRLMAAALATEPQIEKLARDIAKSQGRALSRPRHQLSAGAGRRAEAEGNLLHPRRRLRRRRTQARADRADRREHAGGGDRAVRPGVREDRLQHAGSRRPRRQHHPDDRRQGGGGSDHRVAGDDRAARHGRDLHADGLCHSGAAIGLSYRRGHGHRRRPAAQSREIGDRRIGRRPASLRHFRSSKIC